MALAFVFPGVQSQTLSVWQAPGAPRTCPPGKCWELNLSQTFLQGPGQKKITGMEERDPTRLSVPVTGDWGPGRAASAGPLQVLNINYQGCGGIHSDEFPATGFWRPLQAVAPWSLSDWHKALQVSTLGETWFSGPATPSAGPQWLGLISVAACA